MTNLILLAALAQCPGGDCLLLKAPATITVEVLGVVVEPVQKVREAKPARKTVARAARAKPARRAAAHVVRPFVQRQPARKLLRAIRRR